VVDCGRRRLAAKLNNYACAACPLMAGYDASIMAKLWRRSAPNYIRSTSSTGARGRRPICDHIQASVRPTDWPTDERITPTTTPPINCHISCWVDPLYSNNWPTSWILYLLFTNKVKKTKGSPYSITERRVPELIPIIGSQPAGDVSHKPGGTLPLLSARPERAATNFAVWWTEAQWV